MFMSNDGDNSDAEERNVFMSAVDGELDDDAAVGEPKTS